MADTDLGSEKLDSSHGDSDQRNLSTDKRDQSSTSSRMAGDTENPKDGNTNNPFESEGSEIDLFSDEEEARQNVVDFISQFVKKDKKTELNSKLKKVGVDNISDLEHLDLEKHFCDLLTPVEIGKLKKGFEGIGKSLDKEGPGLEIFDIPKMFSRNQLNLLDNTDGKLSHSQLIDITKAVGDHLYLNCSAVSTDLCKKVAKLLFTKYGKALKGSTGLTKGLEVVNLTSQIKNRVRYCQRLKRKRSPKPPVELRAFSKRQCHGLDPEKDLPTDFPDGETKESQEEKRLIMVEMKESGEVNKKQLKKLMDETYVSIRLTINALPNMEKILLDWPYIGKYKCLRDHFYRLMNLDMDSVGENMNSLFPKVIKFLKAEADLKKKGNAGEIVKNIRKVMIKYESQEESEDLGFITIFLGLAAKLDIDLSSVILYFSETTSFDEVEASENLPSSGKPIIAVLGDDLFDIPKCFVLVDNRIISSEPVSPMNAIKSLFMAYFVFKITYPKNLQPLLNFFERDVFLIIADESSGGRVERLKKKSGTWECTPKALASKYITLMQQIDDYIQRWTTDSL